MDHWLEGELVCFVQRLSPEFKELLIAPTSDVHYGNRMFSLSCFKAHRKAIEDTPNMYTVLNGDLCESTIKSSKGDIFSQAGTPQDQRDWTIEQWYPLRHKVLAVDMGNHEARIYNEAGIDICTDIAKALGVPYRSEGFLLKTVFGSGNERHQEKPYVYEGYFTHGYGGARTSAAKAVKVERSSTFTHADYYCMSPQTKVLSGGLVWRELGDVRVGDELMGVSENPEFNQTRRVLHTCVTDVRSRFARTLRVTLEDGTCVTTTLDHLWLTRRRPSGTALGGRYNWYRADSLSVGDELLQVFPVWESRNDWETGYISGLLDGEGSITVSDAYRSRVATFGQNEGEVMDYVEGYLRGNDIQYRKYARDNGFAQLVVSVDAAKLIGMTQPLRLREKARLLVEKRIHKPKLLRIANIVPSGRREVVTIETDAHTFIAEGLATHNCMSHDHLANAAPSNYLMSDKRTHRDRNGFEVSPVKAHRKMLIKSNAFMKWGGYSERGGYPPVDMETPIIMLAGEGKPRIRVLI